MATNTAKKIGPGVSVVRSGQVEAFSGQAASTEPTANELLAQIAKLQSERDALAAQVSKGSGSGRLTCKVSAKGGVSVYGLGRFPVTLYAEQWMKLKAFMPEVEGFITGNDGKQVKVSGKDENGVPFEKTITFSSKRTE